MDSLFAQLFLAIQEHIKTEVPAIEWIDQDLGQLEAYQTRPAVSFPCVLIDFPTTQYSNHSQMVQWADINISVRLGFTPFSSANSEAPDVSKEAALQFYELENKVYEALQGFTANDCVQPLNRISVATERRDDVYRVREMIFTTATEDITAKHPVNIVDADLVVDKEIS